MDTMDSFGLEIANKAMLDDLHTSAFNTSGDQESANQHYYLSFVNVSIDYNLGIECIKYR